jgi:hypothetical protein
MSKLNLLIALQILVGCNLQANPNKQFFRRMYFQIAPAILSASGLIGAIQLHKIMSYKPVDPMKPIAKKTISTDKNNKNSK